MILAIEASISGGSLSLIDNESEVSHWIGTSNWLRAEEVLHHIDIMLGGGGHSSQDLDLIAVSAGPGSFTGIRIGIATSLGLATGLGIESASESALIAMAERHQGHQSLIAAVPAGRETVCYQAFDTSDGVNEVDEPRNEPENQFFSRYLADEVSTFLLHSELFQKLGPKAQAIDFGRNIAFAIGMVCNNYPRIKKAPIFISKI